MKKIFTILLVALSVGVSAQIFAHSGGTNSEGCHTNKKTGEYHCHNKK